MPACYIFAVQQLLDWLPFYERENPRDALVGDLYALTTWLCGGPAPTLLSLYDPDTLAKRVASTLAAHREGGWGEGTDKYAIPRREAAADILEFAWILYSEADAWSYEADKPEKVGQAMNKARNAIIKANSFR